MKKTLNRVRRTKKSTLKRKADKMYADVVKSVGRCQIRGLDALRCSTGLQCMHILGRSNHNLRWDTLNGLAGCPAHHVYYTNHPWEWQELIKTHFPNRYKYVNEWRNEIWDKDIEKVIEGLRNVKPFEELI